MSTRVCNLNQRLNFKGRRNYRKEKGSVKYNVRYIMCLCKYIPHCIAPGDGKRLLNINMSLSVLVMKFCASHLIVQRQEGVKETG